MTRRDPLSNVVLALLALALAGAAAAAWGGLTLGNAVLLEAAVSLGLSAFVLTGVTLARTARAGTQPAAEPDPAPPATPGTDIPIAEPSPPAEAPAVPTARPAPGVAARLIPRLKVLARRATRWLRQEQNRGIRLAAVVAAALATGFIQLADLTPVSKPTAIALYLAGALCLIGAATAALTARYFASVEPDRLAEAPGLCRGARVAAWILALTAAAVGLELFEQQTVLRAFDVFAVAVNAAFCYGLLRHWPHYRGSQAFALDLGVLSLLGSRPNILASVVDTAERQLGIDLRSTWALTVVRRSLEPLVLGLCLIGWLTTSLTVVGMEEQALLERFGVPLEGAPLGPGLRLHWPWPIDKVFRMPVRRVQTVTVGHEGSLPRTGPEDVLWARQHGGNEFTLLLGDGRDLITVDGEVQYRITDARAWRYGSQNPVEALRVAAYRAVMRNTVSRTLADALSENIVATTARMRAMVQQDADSMGLGVEVLGFTVGGMHPPVAVAHDYQAVVSAELGKVTAVVSAQTFGSRTVTYTRTETFRRANTARGQGAETLARAAGEAWSFRALQAQYNAAPAEFFFRRRLEALEKSLAVRRYSVVDFRFLRDGGELWLNP